MSEELPKSVCCNVTAWAPLDGSYYQCDKCGQPCEIIKPSSIVNEEQPMECKIDQHIPTENGQECLCRYFTHLTHDQKESVVKLINGEINNNVENGNEAYNTHWKNIKMALGYAIVK